MYINNVAASSKPVNQHGSFLTYLRRHDRHELGRSGSGYNFLPPLFLLAGWVGGGRGCALFSFVVCVSSTTVCSSDLRFSLMDILPITTHDLLTLKSNLNHR